jgi:hypothetical protein
MTSKSASELPTLDKPSSSMAIVSLIAGALGLTLIPFVGSIVAVVTGYMARNEIEASGGELGGEGMANAGVILGWIGVGLTVVGLCVAGLVFGLPLCFALFTILNRGEFSGLLPAILAFA